MCGTDAFPVANIGIRHRIATQARRGAVAERPFRLAAVVGAGLALRLAVAFGPLRHLPLVSDAADYAGQAAQMARGDPVPAYYWPPGTSYVIAAFYDLLGVHPWVAKLSAILVDAANVALVAMRCRIPMFATGKASVPHTGARHGELPSEAAK